MKKKLLALVSAAALCAGLMVPVSAAGQTFTDVPQSHWANEFIDYAVDKGYFSGTSADTFSPDGTMTRAMLWTVLSRMDGYTGTAGPGDPWYQNGRDWAMANGISDGTSPDGSITREQFATMLYNFAKHTGKNTDKDSAVLNQFADRSSIASYAVDAMAWAVTQGIISGTSSSTISPSGLATRAQAAAMLMRFDKMGEGTPVDPEEPDYETIFRVMNAPPLYPGDTIEVGDLAFIAIGSEPYGANVAAGVTYTVTCSDPSMVEIYRDGSLSRDEVCYSVKGLKAGTATLTAVGSDGFRGSVTITIKGDETNPTDPGGSDINWGEYAEEKQAMFQATNEERARNGLPALVLDNKLMQAAQIRADECTILFDHVRPDGTSPVTLVKELGLNSGFSEIIRRATWSSGSDAVSSWIRSSAHHDIMLDEESTTIGIGVAKGDDGKYYFVELFGVFDGTVGNNR